MGKWLNQDKQVTKAKYKLFFEKRHQKSIENKLVKQKQFNAASRKIITNIYQLEASRI